MAAKPFSLLLACALTAAQTGSRAQSRTEPEPEGIARGLEAGAADPPLARLQRLALERRRARAQNEREPLAWARDRPQRAAQHRRQLGEIWGDVVGRVDARAELRMHADRMARLNRMLDLTEDAAAALVRPRIEALLARELARHASSMQRVSALAGPR